MRSIASSAAVLCMGFLTSCQSTNNNISALDAANIYAENKNTIWSIRDRFSGPFQTFQRIPARDPSKATNEEKTLFASLKRNFPIEYLELYATNSDSLDEIDIILAHFDDDEKWNVTRLVYLQSPLPPPPPGSGIAIFDRCDQRASAWLKQNNGGKSTVFCKLDDHWYANQSVR